MEHLRGAGICGLRRRGSRPPELFCYCTACTSKDVVEQRQKRSVRRRRLQRDERPHHNVVPRSNGEKSPRLPENNKTPFFIGPTRGWNQVVPTYSLQKFSEENLAHSAMLDSRVFVASAVNGHKHCRACVMAGGCVKYRMPGTKERAAISVSYRLQSTHEHKVVLSAP